MNAIQKYVTPQQLTHMHHLVGSDLCRAVELLAGKAGLSARDCAQLREAKTLVGSLKYPDFIQPVRMDEMLWALKWFKERFSAPLSQQGALFDKAAQILGVNLSGPHPLPHDLERRIANEMVIVNRSEPAMKEAV